MSLLSKTTLARLIWGFSIFGGFLCCLFSFVIVEVVLEAYLLLESSFFFCIVLNSALCPPCHVCSALTEDQGVGGEHLHFVASLNRCWLDRSLSGSWCVFWQARRITAQEEVVELHREGSVEGSVLEGRLEKEPLKAKGRSSVLCHCCDRALEHHIWFWSRNQTKKTSSAFQERLSIQRNVTSWNHWRLSPCILKMAAGASWSSMSNH